MNKGEPMANFRIQMKIGEEEELESVSRCGEGFLEDQFKMIDKISVIYGA